MFLKTRCVSNTGTVFILASPVFLLFAMGWQHFAGAMFNTLMASPENHDYGTRMTLSLLLHVPDGIARLLSLCLFAVGAGIYILDVLTGACVTTLNVAKLFISRKRKERHCRNLPATQPGAAATGAGEGRASNSARYSRKGAGLHD